MADSATFAVGRRKEAIARVRISLGQGQITVNGKKISGNIIPPQHSPKLNEVEVILG